MTGPERSQPPSGSATSDEPVAAGSAAAETPVFPKIRKRRKGPYAADECGGEPPADFLKGIHELNAGELFEQHETLELLWRATESDIRYLYQGVLLIGIGAYHLTRGNYHGAQAKLADGIEMLEWFAPVCQRVDVADLRARAQRLLDHVRNLGPGRLGQYDRALIPQVKLLG